MADMNRDADFIRSTASIEETISLMADDISSIERMLRNYIGSNRNSSQSTARDMGNTGQSSRGHFGQNYDNFRRYGSSGRFRSRSYGSSTAERAAEQVLDDFIDGLSDGLVDSVVSSEFKRRWNNELREFEKKIGMSLRDLPYNFGKQITDNLVEQFKRTQFGQRLSSELSSLFDNLFSMLQNQGANWVRSFFRQNGGSGYRPSGFRGTASGFGRAAAQGATSGFARSAAQYGAQSTINYMSKRAAASGGSFTPAPWLSNLAGISGGGGGAIGGAGAPTSAGASSTALTTTGTSMMASGSGGQLATSAIGKMGAGSPYAILIAVAAIIVLTKVIKSLSPAIEGTKKMFEEAKKAGDRYWNSRSQNIKYETERLRKDVEVLIETPFNILRQAAEDVYRVWDQNLRTITATQGYNKAALQDLMAAYADRLRQEGLSSVISAADISENLANVLRSGLSGPVAEEFAYIATRLNAAIPTQDFFSYSSDYAAVVANAISQGKSQAEAIGIANQALELFASNILYASRQLTGGVTTGLTNAQSLFSDAIKIAQMSRTGNVSNISGVLASVSAVIGGVAPDLASAITNLIVEAATGGNQSQLVALRSLAGVNASNTEFLRQLATDPKGLFVELFNNLGRMQKMSEGAYMEVAEGLSSIFGVSLEALARVDFNYLASVISEMNVGTEALYENMELLASGQTTLTAEQLKTQQINKYIVEEGLSYVLDNAAAREVQKHMWDEQLSRQMMEAIYGVELKGAALQFLEGISHTVINLLNILNPLAWVGKAINLISTVAEEAALEADIAKLLTLGRVGTGYPTASELTSLYQLTTRGVTHDLIGNLIDLMSGTSSYGSMRNATQLWQGIGNIPNVITNPLSAGFLLTDPYFRNKVVSWLIPSIYGQSKSPNFGSMYTWRDLRKSTAGYTSSLLSGSGAGIFGNTIPSSSSSSGVAARLNQMLAADYIEQFIRSGEGYSGWAATASQFGIRDLEEAITEAGYTTSQIQSYFEQQQTMQAQQEKQQEYQDQQDFRDKGRQFWVDQLARMDTSIENMTVTNSLLNSILEGQTNFFTGQFAEWRQSWDAFYLKWVSYFVEHQFYNERTGLDYAQIRAQEHAESNGAIYALAEAFNQGVADISDPTVQTNALLSKILLVVSSIMQQNAARGGTALADTLNALAMGLTTNP